MILLCKYWLNSIISIFIKKLFLHLLVCLQELFPTFRILLFHNSRFLKPLIHVLVPFKQHHQLVPGHCEILLFHLFFFPLLLQILKFQKYLLCVLFALRFRLVVVLSKLLAKRHIMLLFQLFFCFIFCTLFPFLHHQAFRFFFYGNKKFAGRRPVNSN